MPTDQTYWCTNCRNFTRAYSYEPGRCWTCERYTLTTRSEAEVLAVVQSNYLMRANIGHQVENSNLRTELDNKRSQISSLNSSLSHAQNQLSTTQNQLTATANQLLAKDNELKELNKKFNDLQIESNKKINEIEKQARKIEELKSMLGKSQEEILDIKIREKERKLDTIIQRLKISRTLILELRKEYRKLIEARLDYDQEIIDNAEDEIEKLKATMLDAEVSVEDMQKICRKVEKIADLKIKQNNFHREQFEARQQVILTPRTPQF